MLNGRNKQLKGTKKNIIVTLCLVCLALPGITSVRAYDVGVKPGFLKYEMNFSVTFLGQSYSETGRITVNIITVTDSTIEGTIEILDTNGTLPTGLANPFPTQEQSFSIDTTTWTATYSSTTGMIIPAGLNVGDTVPGDGTVQGVTDWNGRTALTISSGQSLGFGAVTTEFDKQTGVFLEASGSTGYQGYTATFSIKLTDTSLFGMTPAFLGLAWWIWTIIIVVIAGAILGSLILTRRRKPLNLQTPSTPSPPPPPPA